MKDFIFLLFHLFIGVVKLLQLGGSQAIIAENLLLKQRQIQAARTQSLGPGSGDIRILDTIYV